MPESTWWPTIDPLSRMGKLLARLSTISTTAPYDHFVPAHPEGAAILNEYKELLERTRELHELIGNEEKELEVKKASLEEVLRVRDTLEGLSEEEKGRVGEGIRVRIGESEEKLKGWKEEMDDLVGK